MIKALKFFYKLLIISVIMQVAAFYFVNNIYLGDRDNIEGKIRFIPTNQSDAGSADVGLKIPKGAEDIKVSYDMTYISYIYNETLEIVEVRSKKIVKSVENQFPPQEGKVQDESLLKARIDCYRWFPDRNVVMYVLSAPDNLTGRIQILTFDPSSGNTQVGAGVGEGRVPKGSRASNIVFSPLNMMTYVKVKTNQVQASVYRVNIMDNVSSPFTLDNDAKIKSGYYTENLVYQDNKNRIFVKKGLDSAKQLNLKSKAVLFDVRGDSLTGKDIIYVGELDSAGRVKTIIHGPIGTDPARWTQRTLDRPVDPENLIANDADELYEISESEGTITSITDGKSAKFQGQYIDIISKQLIYYEKEKLKVKLLQ